MWREEEQFASYFVPARRILWLTLFTSIFIPLNRINFFLLLIWNLIIQPTYSWLTVREKTSEISSAINLPPVRRDPVSLPPLDALSFKFHCMRAFFPVFVESYATLRFYLKDNMTREVPVTTWLLLGSLLLKQTSRQCTYKSSRKETPLPSETVFWRLTIVTSYGKAQLFYSGI
jgi:hypothetical protein